MAKAGFVNKSGSLLCQIAEERRKIYFIYIYIYIYVYIYIYIYTHTHTHTHEVRQFNSRNGTVKAKFAYLCTSGWCRLRNTHLVKLRTAWDDGATAGNSLENHFPEYLAVTYSRCVGCPKGQQIFVPSGHFLILERAKNRRGLSQANKVDGPFL